MLEIVCLEGRAPSAPSCTGPQSSCYYLRQLVERPALRTKRRQHDPVVGVPLQARYDASAQERGLSRTRCPQNHHQLFAPLGAAGIEALDQPANVVVAAEIYRSISLVEGQEPWIRWPRLVPWIAAPSI